MLEFVISKMAMMIAAIIILSSVLGIYTLQREQAKDLELRNIADKIADAIDDLNSLQGETKVNVTFERGKEGVYVKPSVKGKNYEIMIAQYKVMISQNHKRSISNLMGPTHSWEPLSNSYTLTQIEEIDGTNRTLELKSGKDFKIERKLIEISGENEYRTFVYV